MSHVFIRGTGHQSITGLRQRGRQPFTIIPTNQFRITNSPNMHVFAPGGSQSTGKESQQAWAEHVISTHQRQPEDSNSGPCCCDTVNHCTTGDQASQFGISFKNRAQCDCSCKQYAFMYLLKVCLRSSFSNPLVISLRLSIAAAIASAAVTPVNGKHCQLQMPSA